MSTNFPFSSSEVTGLFLNVILSGPQGSAQMYQKTMVDNIGYAVRQNGGTPEGSGQPAGSPSINSLAVWTMNVQASDQAPAPIAALQAQAHADAAALGNLANDPNADLNALVAATRYVLIDMSRDYLETLIATSDGYTARLANVSDVMAYFDRPRITFISAALTSTAQGKLHQ